MIVDLNLRRINQEARGAGARGPHRVGVLGTGGLEGTERIRPSAGAAAVTSRRPGTSSPAGRHSTLPRTRTAPGRGSRLCRAGRVHWGLQAAPSPDAGFALFRQNALPWLTASILEHWLQKKPGSVWAERVFQP